MQLVFELDKDWYLENGYTLEEFQEIEKDMEQTEASFHAEDFTIKGFRLERVRYTQPPHEVTL